MKEFVAAVACGWGSLLIVWWMRYGPVGPWVHALWTARRHAGETADVPDDLYVTDQPDPHGQDFLIWESECADKRRARRYARRMDRWSQ